ncbi:hypothetical protein CKO_02103 [Citrobacter koseri ATCC BAA-895]|uniref:Uncharacterized protein n=1 Tax=Citrobacter koseri (strain ATCC BAA-895 / CDC 4225-83 / SGSC4696) TaxID=290338 RepID=A8AIB4_CITK8|nr:hypothetical protein CKO_02103 [Citrobacter koseri ATCC BAA-895]
MTLQEKDEKNARRLVILASVDIKCQEGGCFSAHCRKLLRVCGSACLNQYLSRCSVSA